MVKIAKIKELILATPDKPGMLAEVTSVIAGQNVNIEAICAYSIDNKAIFYIITDDTEKTKNALLARNWKVEESYVISLELPDEIGLAEKISKKLMSSNVSLKRLYGASVGGKKSGKCKLILKSDDFDKIIDALK